MSISLQEEFLSHKNSFIVNKRMMVIFNILIYFVGFTVSSQSDFDKPVHLLQYSTIGVLHKDEHNLQFHFVKFSLVLSTDAPAMSKLLLKIHGFEK